MGRFWDVELPILSAFIFVAYLLVVFQVVVDLFRDTELGGFSNAPPPFHQARVSDRRVQPRPKRFRLANVPNVLIRLEQRVLHHVFRVFRVAADEQTKAIRRFLRAHQKPLHCVPIASCRIFHKPRVLGFNPTVGC